jgi:hypothetical protein
MTREQEIFDAAHREAYLNNEYYNFQLGANWADEHPNWISIKDEKPMLEEDVLVLQVWKSGYTKMAVTHLFEARNVETGEIEILWTDSLCDSRVTHWMPLPKLPKKGGKQ